MANRNERWREFFKGSSIWGFFWAIYHLQHLCSVARNNIVDPAPHFYLQAHIEVAKYILREDINIICFKSNSCSAYNLPDWVSAWSLS